MYLNSQHKTLHNTYCVYLLIKNKLRIFKNTILRQFSSNVQFLKVLCFIEHFKTVGLYNDYDKKTDQVKPLQL